MPSFEYRARDQKGALHHGVMEAAHGADVARAMKQRDLLPVSIEALETRRKELALPSRKKVSSEILIMFSRQMYALLAAGVPITKAILGLAEASRSSTFRRTLLDVSQRLESGTELNLAFQAHREVFSDLYITMVRVGESTGKLEESFHKLAEHLEREREAKRRFKQVTRYPLFLFLAIITALLFINVWVIPEFQGLFSKFDSDLPFATQVLVSSAEFFHDYAWLLVLFALISGAVFWQWVNTTEGALRWSRFVLKVPVLGTLLRYIALSRFVHSFAMVVRAGMPITEGLIISGYASGNPWIAKRISRMRTAIERGESLYPAALISGVFTSLVLQMLAVGEESGNLDVLLEEVAQFYDEEVDYSLKTLTDVIEPTLIIAMGLVVLMLALGVALPIWDLGQAAMGGNVS
ncbi:MAG: type II secretion system F family protein [Oleiphilaceae bacterium]|nr:type II secretion system F family protein [Oleiphilaceae bacterium]